MLGNGHDCLNMAVKFRRSTRQLVSSLDSFNKIIGYTHAALDGSCWPFRGLGALVYQDWPMKVVINAASRATKGLLYAFNSSELPLRRYLLLTQKTPANSIMNLTLPYFDVSLRWVDAASDNRSQNHDDSKHADVASFDFPLRQNDSIRLIRNDTWDAEKAISKAAETLYRTKPISIQIGGFFKDIRWLCFMLRGIAAVCPFGRVARVRSTS